MTPDPKEGQQAEKQLRFHLEGRLALFCGLSDTKVPEIEKQSH